MITTTPNIVHFVISANNASLWFVNALHGANDEIDAALSYIEQGNENDAKQGNFLKP